MFFSCAFLILGASGQLPKEMLPHPAVVTMARGHSHGLLSNGYAVFCQYYLTEVSAINVKSFFFFSDIFEVDNSCVFCSKMDVEFSPLFISLIFTRETPQQVFRDSTVQNHIFFFFLFQNQFELCARHCRYKDEKGS